MPWRKVSHMLPTYVRGTAGAVIGILPLMPDPGVMLQLVHHDDVADAIVLAARGAGKPGAYNLAGKGEVSLSEVAKATGSRAIRIPHATATAASAALARMPMVPAAAEWVHALRTSTVMDTARATRVLGWRPKYTSQQTLQEMAESL